MEKTEKFKEIINRDKEQEFNDFLFEPKKFFQTLNDDIKFLEKLNDDLKR